MTHVWHVIYDHPLFLHVGHDVETADMDGKGISQVLTAATRCPLQVRDLHETWLGANAAPALVHALASVRILCEAERFETLLDESGAGDVSAVEQVSVDDLLRSC